MDVYAFIRSRSKRGIGLCGHIRLVNDLVERVRGAVLQCLRNAAEGLFCLTYQYVVGMFQEKIRLAARPGAADERASAEGPCALKRGQGN